MSATFPGVVASRPLMRPLPGAQRACWCIILTADPAMAAPEALGAPGSVSAVLAHDAGLSWPNRKGVALARTVIEAGGAVALGFATLADALACKRRLDAEAAHAGR